MMWSKTILHLLLMCFMDYCFGENAPLPPDQITVNHLGSTVVFINWTIPYTTADQGRPMCFDISIREEDNTEPANYVTSFFQNQAWVIFANLKSHQDYIFSTNCSVQGTGATFTVTTDFETPEDSQEQVTDHDVLTSVFYPVLDNRDVISAQVSWNRIGMSSESCTSAYVRIMCVKSGRLENIPGSPYKANLSATHFNVMMSDDGVVSFPLPTETHCVVNISLDMTVWSETQVFSTHDPAPKTEAVVVTGNTSNAVRILHTDDETYYEEGPERVSDVALDNKNRVMFRVKCGDENNCKVVKTMFAEDEDLMGYSLPTNLQQPSATYDWVSKMLYVAGRMQMRDSSQFIILRKSVVTGSQEMFTRFFTSSGIQGRTVQITVNPFSRIVHWTTRIRMGSTVTTFLYGLPINHNSPTVVNRNVGITSFAEDVLNNCIFLADRNGSIRYLSSLLPMLSLGGGKTSNCPDNSDNSLPVVLPEEELVRFSLDELGIYFVTKQSNTDAGRDTYRVLYQQHDSNTTFILGDRMNFSDAVSVVLSTSPGMQPYPADFPYTRMTPATMTSTITDAGCSLISSVTTPSLSVHLAQSSIRSMQMSPSPFSISSPTMTPPRRPDGGLSEVATIAVAASTVFVGFILTVVVTVVIILIAFCVLQKRLKKTNDAVCTLYHHAEVGEYETPTYHVRSDAYYSVAGPAAYETPLQRASISNPPHLNVTSTFRPVSPALYEEPVASSTKQAPVASDYEVAVATQLDPDNELYTTLDEVPELIQNSYKQESHVTQTLNDDKSEYSSLIRQSSTSNDAVILTKKTSQKEATYFTLEKPHDDPTDSFRIDQGSEAVVQKSTGEAEKQEEEEAVNDPLPQDGFKMQSEDQPCSKLDRQSST